MGRAYSASDDTSTPLHKVVHHPYSPVPHHFQGSFEFTTVPVLLILRLFGQIEPQHVLYSNQSSQRAQLLDKNDTRTIPELCQLVGSANNLNNSPHSLEKLHYDLEW